MSVTTDSDITGIPSSGNPLSVIGPGSGTDEAILRWDGTTGALAQDSLITISDSGVIKFVSGTIALPSVKFSADAADIGWYRSAAGEWSYAWGSSKRCFSVGSGGIGFHATSANSGSVTLNVSGNSGTATWQFDANIGSWIIQNTSTGGDVIFRLANANTGGLGWAMDSMGSGNGDYVGGFLIASDRSGAQVPFHIGKYDGVSIGGNNSILYRNSVTLVERPETTLTGTSSTNASTSITGSSTLFISQLAPGDRISLNGGTTFATVKTISSNTACTVDTAIGSGGSQSILRRSGFGFVDRTGTAWKAFLDDRGRFLIGNPATAAARAALDVATGAIVGTVVTLTDGATVTPDLSAGNTQTLSTTQNPTIAAPTNPVTGMIWILRIKATSADRTPVLDTGTGGFRGGTDVTLPLGVIASGLTAYILCQYHGTDNKHDVLSIVKGY